MTMLRALRSLSAVRLTLFLAMSMMLTSHLFAAQSEPMIINELNKPTLYIWENENSHSNNEVVLQLVVKAGSLQEQDNELGYAHIVEHMAFNGTERFPKNALQAELTALGLDIGQHSNAYTTFDHTAYQISMNKPTPKKLESAMIILNEWANNVAFDPNSVKAELPIIIEEWRARQTAVPTVHQQLDNDYYRGSRYAERYPIGMFDSIQNATAEGLKRFYQQWYHPSNMAIMVTGDIDAKLIKTLFKNNVEANTQVGQTPETYLLNPEARSDALFVTDPNTYYGRIEFIYHFEEEIEFDDDSSNAWSDIAALDLWLENANRQLEATQGVVTNLEYYFEHVSDSRSQLILEAYVLSSQFDEAINILEGQTQAILANGFTKKAVRDWSKRTLDEVRSEQDSAEYLGEEMLDHFLTDWPLSTQKERLKENKKELKNVNPENALSALKKFTAAEPKIRVIYPTNAAAPTIEDIKQWRLNAKLPSDNPKTSFIENWEIDLPRTGKIVEEKALPNDITQWVLSNGMTVNFINTDDGTGKVAYKLIQAGGLNAVPASSVPAARLLSSVMSQSGLRDLSGQQLGEWLQRNNQSLSAYIDYFSRGLIGQGNADDLETMMRLLYVALTEAQVNEVGFNTVANQVNDYLMTSQQNPLAPWSNAISQTLYQNDIALRELTIEEVKSAQPAVIQRLYNQMIQGAQRYQLNIAGDMTKSRVRRALEKIIVDLPQNDFAVEGLRNYPALSKNETVVVENSGQASAYTIIRYEIDKTRLGDFDEATGNAMSKWVNNALFNDIRENKGLVYSIFASLDGYSVFQADHTLIIQFESAAENSERIVQSINDLLRESIDQPASDDQLQVWLQAVQDEFEQSTNDPAALANVMAYSAISGQFVEDIINPLKSDLPLTGERIANSLAQFISDDAVKVVMTLNP